MGRENHKNRDEVTLKDKDNEHNRQAKANNDFNPFGDVS
jgi:hypothetical protein